LRVYAPSSTGEPKSIDFFTPPPSFTPTPGSGPVVPPPNAAVLSTPRSARGHRGPAAAAAAALAAAGIAPPPNAAATTAALFSAAPPALGAHGAGAGDGGFAATLPAPGIGGGAPAGEEGREAAEGSTGGDSVGVGLVLKEDRRGQHVVGQP
jgi:hypothetical protein